MLKSFNSDVLIFEEIKLLRKKFAVLLSPAFVGGSRATVAMSLELFSVEKVLMTRLTSVELACLLVYTEHVFFQVVACSKSFTAKVASMIALIEMDSKDVASDSGLVTECFITPVTAQLCILMRSSYVS